MRFKAKCTVVLRQTQKRIKGYNITFKGETLLLPNDKVQFMLDRNDYEHLFTEILNINEIEKIKIKISIKHKKQTQIK